MLAYFGTTVEAETAATRLAPSCALYASTTLSICHERAFYEGLAAILPCFLVYLEVAAALRHQGALPHCLCAGGRAGVCSRVPAHAPSGARCAGAAHAGRPGCVRPTACTWTTALRPAAPSWSPTAGSPHPLYKRFLDRFGGQDYCELALEVVGMANEVAAELGQAQVRRAEQAAQRSAPLLPVPSRPRRGCWAGTRPDLPPPRAPLLQRQRMVEIFEHGCRLEFMFWDACYVRMVWPL